MSSPTGLPSEPVRARRLGFEAGDAAVHAAGHHVESQIINVNQDVSTLGAGDAVSSQATQRSGIANQPAAAPPFTRED